MPNKNDIATILAEAHRTMEPTMIRIVRRISASQEDPHEPVKLLR